MNALEVLGLEHRRIEQMLGALDLLGARIESGRGVPDFADDLLDFFQLYADARHHAKEEERLFPILAAHGFAPAHGIVDAMRHQHEMGRIHVRDMRVQLRRIRAGDQQAAIAFGSSAHTYAELLRVHIQIEDTDVYPVAAEKMTPEEEAALAATFTALDGSDTAAEEQARWDRLAEQCRAMAAGR